jgi:Dyp-type peroxidase family
MAFTDQPFSWKSATGVAAAALDGLQPNIIKAHTRERLSMLFLTFSNREGAQKFLKSLATPVNGNVLVKSARTHLQEVEAFKQSGTPGTSYVGVGLTWSGYGALGIPVPRRPNDVSFKNGMKQAAINDPPPQQWEPEYQGDIHCVVLVGDARLTPKNATLRAVRALIAASPGVTETGRQHGKGLHNANGDGIEHFGYVDGRSQPLFLTEDIDAETQKTDGTSTWNPAFAPNRVILPDPASQNTTTDFGSYFIYRKLEQNVKQFKKDEIELGKRLGLEGDERERAGAMVVGRFEDGTPLVTQFGEGNRHPVPNDFDYDSDPSGGKCPHFAHIRKVNPRGSGGFEPEQSERLHIMARRGQTYGARTDEPNDGKTANKPTKDVGLLFMTFNVNIGQQFEFAQNVWANNPGFPQAPTPPGLDLVIGQMPNDDDRPDISAPTSWGGSTRKATSPMPRAVTMKGGEYFFMPSLPFLKNPV